MFTDILLIEEKRFLYFLNAYIGSPGGYPPFCTLYVGALGSFLCFQVGGLLYFYSFTPENSIVPNRRGINLLNECYHSTVFMKMRY
jgi:hypothetical protein